MRTKTTGDGAAPHDSATDEQIRALRIEADEAGDLDQVAICLVALGEDRSAECHLTQDEARAECARVIAEAAAMADEVAS